MKNDINQILEKKRVGMNDVEQVFQVKLHPEPATSTKYVHVFEGTSNPQAVSYDKVEFRKFANDTKFFVIIHMNGKVVMPEIELEKMMGTKGNFEPDDPAREEKATLSFNKNGKKIVFSYSNDMKYLIFFSIEGELQK